MNAPAIGDAGAGAALVGPATNPWLYLATILAIVVMLAAMLVLVDQWEPRR